jgi:aspartate/methionine/tyrosine aminotransferase
MLAAGLDAVEGIEVGPIAQGAFYLFPRVDGLFGLLRPDGAPIRSAMDLADYFLVSVGVGVVPGEAFGEPRCIRVSYALGRDLVEEGVKRIQEAVTKLSRA